jgi:hypothetical protein
MAWSFRGRRTEDFMYYYCAGATANAGSSPYAASPYGDCVRAVVGDARVRLTVPSGSAYPPPAIAAFRVLALLPYDEAFAVWNLLLLAAALAFLRLVCRDPADLLIAATWPAFALCWIYHKITFITAAAFFAAFARLEDSPALAGAALGLQVIQPQWLAAGGLFLAARRRWRPLAAALAAAAALVLLASPAGWLGEWAASARLHAAALTSWDNQSLFLAVYKVLAGLGAARESWFIPGRALFGALLAALAFAAARRGAGLAAFLGLFLLAQPYSHGSDALWALPLLLLARDRWRAALDWSPAAASSAAIAANLVLCWLCLRAPSVRVEAAQRQGTLTALVVLLWGGAEFALLFPPARRGGLSPRRARPRRGT